MAKIATDVELAAIITGIVATAPLPHGTTNRAIACFSTQSPKQSAHTMASPSVR